MSNRSPVSILLGFAAVISISILSDRTAAQSRLAEIGKINSYVAEIDRFIKRNPESRQIVANTAPYDREAPQWNKFKSEAEAETAPEIYENAHVWIRGGNVVATGVTLSSPSGDWAHMITYYYRDDGSLAKIQAQLNTFYGDVSVIRNQYFASRGVLLSSNRKFLDLRTQKPIKRPRDYFDHEAPVYKRIIELPFYKIL